MENFADRIEYIIPFRHLFRRKIPGSFRYCRFCCHIFILKSPNRDINNQKYLYIWLQIYDFFIFTIYGHIDKLFNLRDFPFQNLLESCTDILESRFRRCFSFPIKNKQPTWCIKDGRTERKKTQRLPDSIFIGKFIHILTRALKNNAYIRILSYKHKTESYETFSGIRTNYQPRRKCFSLARTSRTIIG